MYNFDEIINRQHTNSMNTDGFREYIFHDDGTKTFPYKDEEFIRMWIADMEFATPDVVIEGIKERLEDRIFGYTRVFNPEYYEAFSGWCKRRYGWEFPKKHLVMSNGVIPALFELVEHICEEGEEVLFFTPSYAYFKYAADNCGRGIVVSDLDLVNGRFEIDFEDFEEKASRSTTKLLILCNPHNPTGRIWTTEELQKIGDIALKHDLWIISDEIHCDLLRTGRNHTPLAKLFPDEAKLITAMAPSKTFNMAGLMISNIIIPDDELRAKWLKTHYNFDNPLSIAAAQAAYEKGEPWLRELCTYLDDNFSFTREYLSKHLPKAWMADSESTYLAWVDVSHYLKDEESLPLFFAYQAGVLLEGGNMFVDNSDGYIRLNLACPRSVLEEGLKRICNAINSKA